MPYPLDVFIIQLCIWLTDESDWLIRINCVSPLWRRRQKILETPKMAKVCPRNFLAPTRISQNWTRLLKYS